LRPYKPSLYKIKIGKNAIMKHIQRLRKMTRLAHDIEWIENHPFQKYQVTMEKTERDHLTDKELLPIEELEIKIERLQTARDLFVFSYYMDQIGVMKISLGL
jgi:integrase/recombinase XerD